MRTITGRDIDPFNLTATDIDILDIARGLSHCCRFAGQLPTFWSVASHSCLVASLVDPTIRLHALLHDASEAYMGDLSRTIKHHPLLHGYRQVEQRIQSVIEFRFGLVPSPATHHTIKIADDVAAVLERFVVQCAQPIEEFYAAAEITRACKERFIAQGCVETALDLIPLLPTTSAPFRLTPPQAEAQFLQMYEEQA